ncbi:INO80 complex subunit B isoform X2 [Nilaparvata lugens]|uniref:INO80 complex subunit B isoform X2 n=1 Tax=Nilaparvata lugens TaxID=108931 RepID=UPI00193CD3FD|nr:INO80 complex subunit B isoform X2 [Nilaparvata lugens]
MVKRKEPSTPRDNEAESSESPRRHKKHNKKHKKHKKRKFEEFEEVIDVLDPSNIKLTIKLPSDEENIDKVLSEIGVAVKAPVEVKTSPLSSSPSKSSSSKKKKKKGKDGDTSSEEERWLDAIESGKLEEVDDELKKIKPKDPNLMTARQRAMFERKSDKETPGEQLLALPSGYREKVMTPEMVQKAAINSQKRKQLADERREKDRKKTMERLLKKQESKLGKLAGKGKGSKRLVPHVVYLDTHDGKAISFPLGMDIPLKQSEVPKPPSPKFCEVKGCSNIRKYSCSKTGKSLCSLQCYKANLKH